MTFTFSQQLEMNSIIGNLIHVGSDMFDPNDAKRLRELVLDAGIKPKDPFQFSYRETSTLPGKSTCAAGVGNVSLDETKEINFNLGDKNKLLCGNWKITIDSIRNPDIDIDQRFNDTKESEDVEGYRLKFNSSGAPTKLLQYAPMIFKFRLSSNSTFSLIIRRYIQYKRPASSRGPQYSEPHP